MKFSVKQILRINLIVLLFAAVAVAQSRHSAKLTTDTDGTILSVVATRIGESKEPIKLENLYLYENDIEQKIKNLSFDPSPSKIVVLVDNSQTIRADVEALKKATMEFAYEIFEGDQLFVIGFDEKAEIIQEWSDDAKKIEASIATFRKQGNPYLFDALNSTMSEILSPLMPGTRKTAVVLVSDGLDRGSKTSFDKILGQLQNQNITVYALQIPDRTGGAYRRNQPKAPEVIKQLTEGTGGKSFPIEEAQTAAKFIADELRKTRYLLSYQPTNTSSYDARRLFIIADEGILVRTKKAQPPNVK
ncbi:MAG: VWA domain-containing protein [Acidobacteriota bacterium]|jgi:Ca-activated chloride channel family protein|nr:VWA domain-containing protein [Acidobacteriota bacterium]